MSAPRTGASAPEREEIAAAQRMHQLITRSLLVQAIFVACRLRIPDLLAGAVRTAEELAEATGAQPAALHRLFRALTGLDVVTLDGDRFGLTSLGRSLCSGPHSAAESAIFLGSPAVWSAWGALGDAVLDGRERTEEEYRMLLGEAGFTLARVVPTSSPLSVVGAIRDKCVTTTRTLARGPSAADDSVRVAG